MQVFVIVFLQDEFAQLQREFQILKDAAKRLLDEARRKTNSKELSEEFREASVLFASWNETCSSFYYMFLTARNLLACLKEGTGSLLLGFS